MNSDSNYNVARDPIFLITAAFFVPLTTIVPAIMGLRQTMPLLQTFALVLFLAIPLRQRDLRQALFVVGIWVLFQLAILILLGAFFPAQVEQSIPGDFVLRAGLAEWLYTDIAAPAGIQASPMARLLEIVVMIGGTLLTGGLVGAWILVRTVNQIGFSIGILLTELEDVLFPVVLLPWALFRIAAYAGLVALLAEPLWSRNWSPRFYLEERRQLALVSITLLVISLILEAFLPSIWPGLFR